LDYIGAFHNESRINALICELAQPALDRFRTKVKSRSVCEVLHFAPMPRLAEGTIARHAGNRDHRMVFN
jgi:hypothetical protein